MHWSTVTFLKFSLYVQFRPDFAPQYLNSKYSFPNDSWYLNYLSFLKKVPKETIVVMITTIHTVPLLKGLTHF